MKRNMSTPSHSGFYKFTKGQLYNFHVHCYDNHLSPTLFVNVSEMSFLSCVLIVLTSWLPSIVLLTSAIISWYSLLLSAVYVH